MNTIDQPPLGNQSLPEGQIGAFLNLDYVVRNIQMELEDYSMRQYKRLLQLVINGLGILRIYHAGAIQVAYLKVNSAGIVVFPQDYIKYTKIGVYIHGQLVTLTLNNNMALNRAQVCTEDIRVMEKENGIAIISGLNDGYYFAPHFRNGNFIGGLYGAGGGFNQAYYRIDDVAKQIQFNGYIPRGEIVLEY
ncbi:MAG TPA: hypothetical protein VK590_00830, partial [Saprospiraceae bacterium]|nr:hypothetical protein [Saprospiraceae bacterium]